MLLYIMLFLDREAELGRLERVARDGGLVVMYGRRRVGKTRLLLEWVGRHGGVYFVADQSSAAIQRRYFAQAVSGRLPGFDLVEYPSWRAVFDRLAADAAVRRFRGPIVIDELPYLLGTSPELPSVLQQWADHAARGARLAVALSGSSQRMMQGLAFDAAAPLYGRAREILEVAPLAAPFLRRAMPALEGTELLVAWTAWGGIPRYWELAASERGPMAQRIDALVLDPSGPLHQEPDRLLLEELPPAVELRPLLDAIGAGAHRMSELAGRIGRPVTSLSRPLDRLTGLGLVRREVPFGESARETKRSLYRIADPFMRLWFRVVAPNRGLLAAAGPAQRRALLKRLLPALTAEAWEELCRARLSSLGPRCALGALGPWEPAGRWWQGSEPEWDLVSRSADGERALLGEVRAWHAVAKPAAVVAEARRLAARPAPPPAQRAKQVVRALFIPVLAAGTPRRVEDVQVATLDDLLA